MKVTKERVLQDVKIFLGEKWNNSIPYILAQVFTKFADDASVLKDSSDGVSDSVARTYSATANGLTLSLWICSDMAFIHILKIRTDNSLGPNSVSLAKIALTRASLNVEVLLEEEGILDFDSQIINLLGKVTKEIVTIRKQTST